MEARLRLIGREHLQSYLGLAPEADRDLLRAWSLEIVHGRWPDFRALRRSFARVTTSSGRDYRFELASCPVAIDTLIDFRAGVVLVTKVARSEWQ